MLIILSPQAHELSAQEYSEPSLHRQSKHSWHNKQIAQGPPEHWVHPTALLVKI